MQPKLICSACKVPLANGFGPTLQVGGFYWLEAGDYRSRICLCRTCSNPETAPKSVSVWAKKILPKREWANVITVTPACTLEEFVEMATGSQCAECKEELGHIKPYREGWKLFHPECRGQFNGNRKKEIECEGGAGSEESVGL